MEGQVIGFFDNRANADQAFEDLKRSGFSGNEIDTFDPGGRGRVEEGGLIDKIKQFFTGGSELDQQVYAEAARRGEIAIAVDADSDEAINRAAEILQRHNAVDLDKQVEQWQSQGWVGYKAGMQPQQPRQEEKLPVSEEELRIGKRAVSKGGVRIHSRVTEQPVEEQVNLREEHVEVERRPVDRPVQPGEQAFQERTIEATERAEEAVVSKQARVKEEVSIRKGVEQKTETIRDTLKRTDVEVEKLSPEEAARLGDLYGDELAGSERYRGREWSSFEPEARSDFERRYPGYGWDQYRDAIHRRYDRMRQNP